MFGLQPPDFAHLPVLVNQKGQKLSKKFNDLSITSYQDQGYLPEALINFVALLGWNPPHREDPTVLAEATGVFMKHEVIRLEDMILQFNLDKISKTGTKVDIDKLNYLNTMHIESQFIYTKGNI
jgi:glutamyl/glutaminyl-tRNA synthetase